MNSARLKMIISMAIFGTIGIFVNFIAVPSSVVAVCRGFTGAIFLFVFMLLTGKKISFSDIGKNFIRLMVTGCLIGINWILLFESYKYIGVANGTLCYYLEPVILVIGAAIIYREKISPLKALCVAIALIGMVFVSGVFPPSEGAALNGFGIALGLGAAFFYASVVLLNRGIKNISSYDMTMVQLFFAALVALPYVLVTEDITAVSFDVKTIVLLLVVGIIHTGMAYALYFGAVREIKGQDVAVLSYIDPMLAIVLSMTLLGEEMTLWGVLGAVMILGSTLLSELKK